MYEIVDLRDNFILSDNTSVLCYHLK